MKPIGDKIDRKDLKAYYPDGLFAGNLERHLLNGDDYFFKNITNFPAVRVIETSH